MLWCLGVLLVGANLFLYTRHFTGQQERLGRLDELTAQEAEERERLSELQAELTGFDIEWQNEQVRFINLRIAERVFPWSRLFDRLTEAMPRQVRLTRLRPRIESLSGNRSGPEERVGLEIRAEARNEEAILEFVSELFEHDAFREPNLSSEDRRPRSNVTEFSLSATYLPARAEAAAVETTEPEAADDPEAAEADGGEDDETAAGEAEAADEEPAGEDEEPAGEDEEEEE